MNPEFQRNPSAEASLACCIGWAAVVLVLIWRARLLTVLAQQSLRPALRARRRRQRDQPSVSWSAR